MNILYNPLRKRRTPDLEEQTPKRFSRFTDAVDGTSEPPAVEKKFSRFAPRVAQPVYTPVAARSAAAPEPCSVPQHIASSDHLTSEVEIPVSVLFCALPMRFAEMQGDRAGGAYA